MAAPETLQILEQLHAEMILGFARLAPEASLERVLGHAGASAGLCVSCKRVYSLVADPRFSTGLVRGWQCEICRERQRP